MHGDLYPATPRDTTAYRDLLRLLQRPKLSLQVVELDSGDTVEVSGNLDQLVAEIRAWLTQQPERSASPATLCDRVLVGKASTVTLTVHGKEKRP